MNQQNLVNGFTLIEVMICVAIFSFGIVALTELQTRTLRVAENNMQRSQATWVASSIAENIKNNIDGLDKLHYQNTATEANNNITTFCNAVYANCNSRMCYSGSGCTLIPCSSDTLVKLEMIHNLCGNRNLLNLNVDISCNPSCTHNADIDVVLSWDTVGNADISNRQQVHAFTKYP